MKESEGVAADTLLTWRLQPKLCKAAAALWSMDNVHGEREVKTNPNSEFSTTKSPKLQKPIYGFPPTYQWTYNYQLRGLKSEFVQIWPTHRIGFCQLKLQVISIKVHPSLIESKAMWCVSIQAPAAQSWTLAALDARNSWLANTYSILHFAFWEPAANHKSKEETEKEDDAAKAWLHQHLAWSSIHLKVWRETLCNVVASAITIHQRESRWEWLGSRFQMQGLDWKCKIECVCKSWVTSTKSRHLS